MLFLKADTYFREFNLTKPTFFDWATRSANSSETFSRPPDKLNYWAFNISKDIGLNYYTQFWWKFKPLYSIKKIEFKQRRRPYLLLVGVVVGVAAHILATNFGRTFLSPCLKPVNTWKRSFAMIDNDALLLLPPIPTAKISTPACLSTSAGLLTPSDDRLPVTTTRTLARVDDRDLVYRYLLAKRNARPVYDRPRGNRIFLTALNTSYLREKLAKLETGMGLVEYVMMPTRV